MSKTRRPYEWTDEDLQHLLNDDYPDPPLDDSGPRWEEKQQAAYPAWIDWAVIFSGIGIEVALVYLAWRVW